MSANYHTPLSTSEKLAASGATINAPLSELDQAITDLEISSGANMSTDVYDPQDIGADAFDRDNHTGTQAPGTISPQGVGSGLDADTVQGKTPAELGGGAFTPASPFLFLDDFICNANNVGIYPWDVTGGISLVEGIANHPGIAEINIGSNLDGIVATKSLTKRPFVLGDIDEIYFTVRFLDTNNDATVRFGVVLNYEEGYSGIGFEKVDGNNYVNGYARYPQGELPIPITTSLVIPGTNWHTYKCRKISDTSAAFSVDGGSEVILSGNFPGADMPVVPAIVRTDTNGTARLMQVDLIAVKTKALSR
jgi:hypothetical protein